MMEFTQIPEIETHRLKMRGFTPDDLDDLCLIFGDPDVMKYIAGGRTRSREETEQGLLRTIAGFRDRGFGLWALEQKGVGSVIGYCGLTYLDGTTQIELAYGLAKAYWGDGFATEAARATLKYGFSTLKLERIVAVVYPDNYPSRRVVEKLGMLNKGLVHHYNAELICYELKREDLSDDGGPGRA